MVVDNEKESGSMEKIEKQSNPNVMNLLQRKVDVITFQFQSTIVRTLKMAPLSVDITTIDV